MPAPEEMSRDELIALVGVQAEQIAELIETNEVLVGKLARLEHLLSRNSRNSSNPPSKDDGPGKTPPRVMSKGGGPTRFKGKQRGASGANLGWTDTPDERTDRFPEGRCECGHDLADAVDLGIVDR